MRINTRIKGKFIVWKGWKFCHICTVPNYNNIVSWHFIVINKERPRAIGARWKKPWAYPQLKGPTQLPGDMQEEGGGLLMMGWVCRGTVEDEKIDCV